ncbi:MAG: hypothetical protein GX600_08640 [Dehalococcoidia bacterium]|nr:hypothetical protein [Dehalococcoidia bacterium]
MASQATDEPILEMWRDSEADDSEVPLGVTASHGRRNSYTDILSPTRQALTASLLTPREVTNDTWLKILRRICWKTGSRLP